MKKIKVLFTASFLLLIASFLPAQTKTFTGPGNFSDPTKWNGGTLPNAGNNLRINGSCVFDNAAPNLAYGSLIVGFASAGTLSWPAAGTNTLNVTAVSSSVNGSAIDMSNGGTLQIRSSWSTANMTFTPGTGTILWNVTAAGSILPNTVPVYYNLTTNTGTRTVRTGTATTVQNNISVQAGTFRITGVNFNNNAAACTTSVSGTLRFSGTGGTKNFRNIIINTGGTLRFTAAETVAILGNLELNGATTNGTATGIVNVSGNFTVGTGTSSMNRLTLSVTGSSTVNGTLNILSNLGNKNLSSLTVDGTFTNTAANESFDISGDLSNNGTINAGNGTYTLSGATRLIGGVSPFTIPNLAVSGAYTNNGIITVSNIFGSASGTLTQGTGTLGIGVSNANFTLGTFNASSAGNTVNYVLAGAQNIRTPNDGAYHHLGIAGSGTKSLTAALNVNGNLNISSTLDVTASNFSINLAGNWSSTGTFVPNSGTVFFNGTTGTQTITRTGGETFNHTQFSGAASKVLGSDISSNNLTITSGATLDAGASSFTLFVRGAWMNNGTFNAQNGTVECNGTTAQTIGGSSLTRFRNLTINNAAGVSLSASQEITGTLQLSSGMFTTTGFNFTFLSTAAGTARIGTITGGNITGNIIMQRYIPVAPNDWRFLASPMTGTHTLAEWSDDFIMAGFPGSQYPNDPVPSIWTYNEPEPGYKDSGFVPASSITNTIPNGTGFWCYMGPTPLTVDITGTPQKFNVNIPVSFTSTSTLDDDGWNMIANPYPSAINWDDPSWIKVNIDDEVSIWNPGLQVYAQYAGGIGINGGANIIPSSQAFWVHANAAGPSLTITESCKTATDTPFIRLNDQQFALVYQDVLRLTMSGNNYADETVIRFDSQASDSFDMNLDAQKFFTLSWDAPQLTSVWQGSDYGINAIPFPSGNISIPLRAYAPWGYPGTYVISRDSVWDLPEGMCVVLEDMYNGNLTDLRTNLAYSFYHSDTAWAPRFLLHIGKPIDKSRQDVLCGGDSSGYAVAKGNGSGPWDYTWKDMQNNVLRQVSNAGGPDTLSNLSPGTYRVEVSGNPGLCAMLSDTIIISGPYPVQVSSGITNESCSGDGDGAINVYAVTGGTSPFTFLWSNGATTQSLAQLNAGAYTLTLTDANGCVMQVPFTLSANASLAPSFTVSADTLTLGTNPSVQFAFTNTSTGYTSFLWYFGDYTFENLNPNPVHSYSQPGTYNVTLTLFSGSCVSSVTQPVTVLQGSATGITENGASGSFGLQELGDGLFYFSSGNADVPVRLSLYNLAGQEPLMVTELGKGESGKLLSFAQLGAGCYLLEAVSADAREVFRLIIAR